jgi:hypothetical protein
MDTLEWANWLRAIWEAKLTILEPVDYIRPAKEFDDALDGVTFLNYWIEALIHVGRVYEDD